ncbi:transcriptional regulator, TetR family [Micrococcales bacterium KH10]|nr:transcriptional regulator, TetR family [Micrococcales bacterium KH10]
MMVMASSSDSETFTEKARRAQLLKAAIDTVNEIGYPNASLSAIAKRAGAAKSAITYYFATKEALLLQVVDHVFTDIGNLQVQAVAAHDEPRARLRAYAQSYLDYADTHRAEIVAGVEILVSHRGADGIPLYLTTTDEDSALLRQILSEGMQQGLFRTLPLHLAVSLVESLLDLSPTELQRDLNADLTELNAEIIRIILRGLEPSIE